MRLATMYRVLCGILAFLLSGCPMGAHHNFIPGPRLQSQYPYDIQYEATLTDGSSRTGTLPPCGSADFFPLLRAAPGDWKRSVFLEQLTIRRDGVAQARLPGAEVEAASQREEMTVAVVDEAGLRRTLGTAPCSLVLNTLVDDMHVRAVYKEGSESLATWRACRPYVWSGRDIARPDQPRNNLNRLVITHGGEVLHDLDRKMFKAVFKARLKRWHFVDQGPQPSWQSDHRPWLDMVLVDESGFKSVPGSHLQVGLDYQSFCVKADTGSNDDGDIAP